ncbi:hypothetical protein ACLI09_07530 [Flavobacterium sp. RHBU_24]|uniref:hypothetical protein n=1 Tax=Flavobacterium sp. RHBU_24 TaxID=3391185 RepID=UPI0039848504
MKNIFYALIAALTLVSCNDDSLSFSAFTIKDKAGMVNIAVAEDGTITSWGKKAGTLGHDGTVTDATGRQTATLSGNGLLTGLDGNTLVTIDDDGTIHIENSAELSWNNAGELVKGGHKLGTQLTPSDKISHRAASVVFYLYSGMFAR